MGFLDLPLENPITAVLYVWHGGQEGGRAAADVISGHMTPCGKLADTIAGGIEDYPSTANHGGLRENVYQEDIYVGYRYFETFAPEKVGSPLASACPIPHSPSEKPGCARVRNDRIELPIYVRNTGSRYAGKEVVQVYLQRTPGKTGTAARELAAFVKTGLLNPGEEEALTLSFPRRYDGGL